MIASRRRLTALFFSLILAGIAARFAAPGAKVFWGDEVYATARMAGVTRQETAERLAAQGGRTLTQQDLRRLVEPDPSRGVSDVLSSLRREDPQHSPLYYVLGHFWIRTFGVTPSTLRVFSAILATLAIPAVYWFSWELFGSAALALLITALFSISPLQWVFAQQVRQYGFWMACIAASSAAFVRALRRKDSRCWWLHAALTIVSCHVFSLSVFILFGQALAVIQLRSRLHSRTIRGFVLSAGVSVLAFAPWARWIVSQSDMVVSYLFKPFPGVAGMAAGYFLNGLRIFFDLGAYEGDGFPSDIATLGSGVFLGGLGVAFFRQWKQSNDRERSIPGAVLLWLAAFPLAVMVGYDLFRGSSRSLFIRYSLSLPLVADCMAGWLIWQCLESRKRLERRRGLAVLGLLMLSSLVSFQAWIRADSWWTTRPRKFAEWIHRVKQEPEVPQVMLVPSDPMRWIAASFDQAPSVAVHVVSDFDQLKRLNFPRFNGILFYELGRPEWPSRPLMTDLNRTYLRDPIGWADEGQPWAHQFIRK